jgi:hypothetical protein
LILIADYATFVTCNEGETTLVEYRHGIACISTLPSEFSTVQRGQFHIFAADVLVVMIGGIKVVAGRADDVDDDVEGTADSDDDGTLASVRTGAKDGEDDAADDLPSGLAPSRSNAYQFHFFYHIADKEGVMHQRQERLPKQHDQYRGSSTVMQALLKSAFMKSFQTTS